MNVSVKKHMDCYFVKCACVRDIQRLYLAVNWSLVHWVWHAKIIKGAKRHYLSLCRALELSKIDADHLKME